MWPQGKDRTSKLSTRSLRKNGPGQKNNGHTGSSCLDKPGGGEEVCFVRPVPALDPATHTHTCTKTTPEPATNTRFCVWETKKEIPSCTRLYNNQAFPLILPNELTLGGGS